MSLLSANLKNLRKKMSLTQEQLAQKTGIKRSLIGSYEEGRAEPKIETLQKLALFFGLSLDDMVHKNFENLQDDDITTRKSAFLKDIEGAGLRVLPIVVDDKNDETISVVPQPAAAGYLNGYSDPEYIGELARLKIPMLPSSGTCRAFQIKGDSMLPVDDGHFIIAEYLQNWNDIKNGKTYIVVSKSEGIVYKRLTNNIRNENSILLSSDNPVYEPYNIEISEILEIWKAIAWFSFELPGDDQIQKSNFLGMMQEMKKEIYAMKKRMP